MPMLAGLPEPLDMDFNVLSMFLQFSRVVLRES